MNKESLISVKDVTKSYTDGTKALRGVSFDIKPGEFVAVMGPSGSGKSTLLHIIGLLDNKTSGEYIFEGESSDSFSRDELAHLRNKTMGFVFQSFNLLRRASVLENVMLPLVYSKIPENEWEPRAKDAIKAVGLSHREEHESMELSGGERQRVAIARALVNDPSVIFADEPTGNLDSKSGKSIMEILKELNKQGKTVIVITHEAQTSSYAKRVIELKDGEIVYDGSRRGRKGK